MAGCGRCAAHSADDPHVWPRGLLALQTIVPIASLTNAAAMHSKCASSGICAELAGGGGREEEIAGFQPICDILKLIADVLEDGGHERAWRRQGV